jgi:hypothetical protein
LNFRRVCGEDVAQYLRLLCLCFLSLESLLAVAFDHDQGQERANHSTSDQDENDRNTDCPDTRREERLRGVRRVDKRLKGTMSGYEEV